MSLVVAHFQLDDTNTIEKMQNGMVITFTPEGFLASQKGEGLRFSRASKALGFSPPKNEAKKKAKGGGRAKGTVALRPQAEAPVPSHHRGADSAAR